jgi:hypothetical protein
VKNLIGVVAAKSLEESEFEWIEPEFGSAVIALNVDMRRLIPVGHVKEETETAFAQDRGHTFVCGVSV